MPSSLPQRLSFVTVGTRDLPALRAFYSRALGWEEVPGGDDNWVAHLTGGVILSLYPSDELAAEAQEGPGPYAAVREPRRDRGLRRGRGGRAGLIGSYRSAPTGAPRGATPA